MPTRKGPRTSRSRRQEHSSSTRRALLDSATELFTEHGYAGTSLEEVVTDARVTKGALYHHYAGKLDLFEHVVQRTQKKATRSITHELKKYKDPWERAEVGLRAFLGICQEPTYRRIVMQEAPVALGADRFAEVDRKSAFGLVEKIVADLLADTEVSRELRETFAVIFYGSMHTAGGYVADAEDPETASQNAETVIGAVLSGLRGLGGLGAAVGPGTSGSKPGPGDD